MIVVSNTSPIINLASVGQLDLLQKLYGRIAIPKAVYHEVVFKGAGQAEWPNCHHCNGLSLIKLSISSLSLHFERNLMKGNRKRLPWLYVHTLRLAGE